MAIRRSDKTELRRHQQYYVGPEFIQVNNLDAAAQTDAQEDSGEGGSGSGTPGSMGPLVDLSAFGLTGTAEFLLAQLIRQGKRSSVGFPILKTQINNTVQMRA